MVLDSRSKLYFSSEACCKQAKKWKGVEGQDIMWQTKANLINNEYIIIKFG